MNDIDEKLHLEQRESITSNTEAGEAENNASDDENSALASPFDIGFMDPEERALLDMLESEGRSTNETILNKDFLGFPSSNNASRLSHLPRRTRAAPRTNSEFLRVFFEDESFGSNEEDSTASLLELIDDKDRPCTEHSGSSIEHLVKKAVAGFIYTIV